MGHCLGLRNVNNRYNEHLPVFLQPHRFQPSSHRSCCPRCHCSCCPNRSTCPFPGQGPRPWLCFHRAPQTWRQLCLLHCRGSCFCRGCPPDLHHHPPRR